MTVTTSVDVAPCGTVESLCPLTAVSRWYDGGSSAVAEACEHIARVEGPRCPYSGAVVVAAHDGALDAGLVVRTFRGERQPVAA